MNLIQLAGLYFLGTEAFNSSNSMMATVVLKEKIDHEKLVQSYQELIRDHPVLQTKIIESPEKNRFYWGLFSADELERLLSFEEEQLSQRQDQEMCLRQYYPSNTRLPFYLSVVDDNTVVIAMNHALANGRCFVFWIQKWLQYYGEDRDVTGSAPLTARGFRHKNLRWLKRIEAFLWLPVFIAAFLFKAGNHSGRTTVDLSYEKKPDKSNDYATKSYSLSREDTKELLRRCKLKKMTLTEYMCARLAQGLLQHAPGKRRVFMSLPMDLQSLLPYTPENTRGNLIASLPVQFFGDGDIEKQVKSVFKWFKRGLPYSLSCLFAVVSTSYEKSKAQCLKLCKTPLPERAPLWNFSLTYSNLGILSHPVMEKLMESIYFSFKSQSILLVTSTISGRLCMNISLSKDLYNAEEVFTLFDKVLAME